MGDAFWADGRSDEFKEGYALGYHDGSKDDTSPILTDLIAESRAWLAGDHPEPLVWMLNRAERRLRGVQGE